MYKFDFGFFIGYLVVGSGKWVGVDFFGYRFYVGIGIVLNNVIFVVFDVFYQFFVMQWYIVVGVVCVYVGDYCIIFFQYIQLDLFVGKYVYFVIDLLQVFCYFIVCIGNVSDFFVCYFQVCYYDF